MIRIVETEKKGIRIGRKGRYRVKRIEKEVVYENRRIVMDEDRRGREWVQ